jgi:DNA-nicking Smr family endonuclease
MPRLGAFCPRVKKVVRRTARALSEEEQILWSKVIKQVAAIENLPPLVFHHTKPPIRTAPKETPKEIKPFRIGAKVSTPPLTPSFAERPTQTSPNMDRRNFQRLLKGQLEIDATLDLHGLTADQARLQLQTFIQNANRIGNRLLLIITGKGNSKSVDEFNRPRAGVLKSGVRDWLGTSPLSGKILQVTQAHGKHGGGGAYYVYLRRQR